MKYIDEYRDKKAFQGILEKIHKLSKNRWRIMEVCGGQTHAIMKYGIDELLPSNIDLIHGPGCPVCVTPLAKIDLAIKLAELSQVIFCSFGDMLRVPGSKGDLLAAKANGADVRIVYSPSDALEIAMNNPSKQVVFFAIGFETTAPANAIAILKAEHLNINNFFELVSQFRVPPAMATILKSEDCGIDGFLAAGHVNTVMGYHEYESISQKYAVPIVVSGFEPVDLIYAIYLLVQSLEQGKVGVSNAYKRAVSREGNVIAQKTLNRVFKISDQDWRGIGCIKNSGLAINSNYERYDAQIAFGVSGMITTENEQCISGQILSGRKKPHECEHFAISCKPDRPLGATMVSVEGACSAYYRYHR